MALAEINNKKLIGMNQLLLNRRLQIFSFISDSSGPILKHLSLPRIPQPQQPTERLLSLPKYLYNSRAHSWVCAQLEVAVVWFVLTFLESSK